MTFRQITRAEMLEPYSMLWNMEYPDMRKTPNQVRLEYVQMSSGSFEEHWISGALEAPEAMLSAGDWHGGGVANVLNFDLLVNPPTHIENYVETVHKAEEIAEMAGTKAISIWVCNRAPDRIAYLAEQGYKCAQTVPVTRLHLPSFTFDDPEEPSGIRFTTMAELDDEGFDWVPGLYDATWEMAQDMPNPHPPTRMPFDQYQENMLEREVFVRELMFVALDGDRIVAYSRVTPSEGMPELVSTGMSGTVRSHRRRGIVRALKLRGIRALADLGYQWLQTDNDETNPMYQLNLTLGFRNIFEWRFYEKAIG